MEKETLTIALCLLCIALSITTIVILLQNNLAREAIVESLNIEFIYDQEKEQESYINQEEIDKETSSEEVDDNKEDQEDSNDEENLEETSKDNEQEDEDNKEIDEDSEEKDSESTQSEEEWNIVTAATIQFDETVWPTTTTLVDSAFGPRIKSSENRYDFHRAIDIEGETTDSIYAIADGTVYRMYYDDGEGPYESSGNVIIIEHEMDVSLPFREEYTKYYSLYAHLSEMDVEEDQEVAKGEAIGKMGKSGSASDVHLHFEIRVQTTCSLDYQRESPESSCAQYGFDPHVNPLLFLEYEQSNDFDVEIVDTNPVTIHIVQDEEEMDFNEVYIKHNDEEKIINFNTREGIDPEDRDNNEYDGVAIGAVGISGGEKELTIIFEDFSDYDEIQVLDIWGNGIQIKK